MNFVRWSYHYVIHLEIRIVLVVSSACEEVTISFPLRVLFFARITVRRAGFFSR